MNTYTLGSSGRRTFDLTDEDLETGVAVLGTTGSGKSSFLRQLMREHVRNGRGLLCIEPGDLNADFLSDLAHEVLARGRRSLLKKIHWIELHPQQLPRYDLFQTPDLSAYHPELRDVFYQAWQHTACMSRAEVYQGKSAGETSLEGHPRVERTLMNVFDALSTLVQGRRLPAKKAAALVDPTHPDHEAAYRQVKDRLKRETRSDLEMLRNFTRLSDVRAENEAALNRIRSMHGPLLRQMLSSTGAEPAFSMQRAVESGDFVLVSTAKTPWASHEQNVGLARMLMHDWIEALQNCPRDRRRGSTLILDEAHFYLTDELIRAQRVIRKYKGGLVLSFLGLASLRKKDIDYAPDVLGLTNTDVCFRQKWPDDVDLMARVLFTPNLDFTPLVHDVYQHRGEYQWLKVREVSRTFNRQTQWGRADSLGDTVTVTEGEKEEETEQETWSNGKTKQRTSGTSDVAGWNAGDTSSDGQADSPIIQDGQLKRTLKVGSGQRGSSSGESGSHAIQSGEMEGETDTKGGSRGRSKGRTRNEAVGKQRGITVSDGGSEGEGITIAEKLMPMPVIIHDQQKTGQLERPVDQQFAEYGRQITSQPQRHAIVRTGGEKAFAIETLEVRESFASPQAQLKAVSQLRRTLYATHPYYFTPSADEERLPEDGSGEDIDDARQDPEEADEADSEEARYL
jgi:hypothetical protein